MRLQGLNVPKHSKDIESTSENALAFLSGNAVNFFNLAQGLVAAMGALDIPWFSASNAQ